jgi:hypothetical protein
MGHNESNIHMSEDHFVKNHPGPITNADIIEVDKDKQNLYGTGTLTDMDKDILDQYLDTSMNN